MTTNYQLHPLCELFPVATELEIAALAEDICRDRLRERITLHEGKILDGRNRYLASQKADVTFEPFDEYFVEYDGDTSDEGLLQFVLTKMRVADTCGRARKH